MSEGGRMHELPGAPLRRACVQYKGWVQQHGGGHHGRGDVECYFFRWP